MNSRVRPKTLSDRVAAIEQQLREQNIAATKAMQDIQSQVTVLTPEPTPTPTPTPTPEPSGPLGYGEGIYGYGVYGEGSTT